MENRDAAVLDNYLTNRSAQQASLPLASRGTATHGCSSNTLSVLPHDEMLGMPMLLNVDAAS